MAFVNATSLDTVRIECVGEARAVTCPGGVWVELRDRHNAMLEAIRRVLAIAEDDDRTMGDVCDAVGQEFDKYREAA